MALHLNLLHEEIQEQRQRQRDPLKIGMLVLGSFGTLMFLYYMWNAYQTLEIRSRLRHGARRLEQGRTPGDRGAEAFDRIDRHHQDDQRAR